jgi:hypothetical protein
MSGGFPERIASPARSNSPAARFGHEKIGVNGALAFAASLF